MAKKLYNMKLYILKSSMISINNPSVGFHIHGLPDIEILYP